MPSTKKPSRTASRVAFVTLGCPKNEVDSDRMAASLGDGFELVADLHSADVVVVNTCSFIREATEESIAVILDVAGDWKTQDPAHRKLVVTGCMPSRYGEDLAGSMPEVDAFVPVDDEGQLAAVISELTGVAGQASASGASRLRPGPSAYLQVADGCHRTCTYCIIPAIRGPYRSRTADEILDEARELVDGGAKELVLIGQDISSWGRDLEGRPTLADLIRAFDGVDGLRWLRLMYVQPDEITPDLLDAMASSTVACRYLDMPLQHASKDVLHRMGRRGDASEFLRLIGVVRDLLPGVVLRTTLIAGFPGETREDSQRLFDFVREAGLDYVGVFPYSPEEGTAAAEMADQVPKRTRIARAQRLRDASDEIGTTRVGRYIGSVIEVLVEGVDEENVPYGRHRGQAPEIDGIVLLDREVPPGEIVQVLVTDTLGYDLIGEVR